jgi:hypothetical protein
MPGIKIIENQDGSIAFLPDRPNAQPNQPLGVNAKALVTWNNETNRTITLQAVPAGSEPKYITEPIPPGSVSSPIFQVTQSFTYSCVDPPQPQHKIVVSGTA